MVKNLLNGYMFAKNRVIKAGYLAELRWQSQLDFENITEHIFLREHAWVVLSSGMNEKVIRKHFRNISFCFYEWESAKKISEMSKFCIESAMEIFSNHKKISSIAKAAEIVDRIGFKTLKKQIMTNPIDVLMQFPFIGPITSYHLSKNLGLPVAKADRHLQRLADAVGYSSVQNFCNCIAENIEDSIAVVDIVLWRYATITTDYIKKFNHMASF